MAGRRGMGMASAELVIKVFQDLRSLNKNRDAKSSRGIVTARSDLL